MLKVVGLSEDSPLLYEAAYLTCEVQGILQQYSKRRENLGYNVVANDKVLRFFSKLQNEILCGTQTH